MDYHTMKRKELQALCKKNNIPANLTNLEMANKLTSLIKEAGKPKAPGPSCLKNAIEVVVIEDSDVVSKPSKKVKFSPQNELFEFTNSNPREMRRMTRRNSMYVNNPVRATRTRTQNLLDDGLVSSMNHPVEKEKGSKSKKVITKTDELKLPTRRLLRKREVVQNDAVSTQNHSEDEERFECDEEIVNKVVRTTRSRAQGAVNDGFVSIMDPPVEKKKGSKSRNVVAEIDEVKLPTKRLLRNRKVDQIDADSIQNHVEDAERFKPNEEIVNNPDRVTRSRTESSVDEGLASTMNPPVKMKSGRKSIVEITKIDEVKLPTRRLLRNRKVDQIDADSIQNHVEDAERFEPNEEIVNNPVRVTRSRTESSVEGLASTMNPPVKMKSGRKSIVEITKIDEVKLPTRRLLRNRKVDQIDADSIQNHVEDAERFEPNEEIVNNPVRVTRSRAESSVDEGLASTMNPPVKMKSGRKSIVEITKIDEVKLPTRTLLRNREVKETSIESIQSHIAKRGRKRRLDKLQEPQCVTVLSDDNCDNKEEQPAGVLKRNGGKRQTSGRYNRRKTVVSQLADEEKVENPKADVVDSSDVITSEQSPNLENPDGAEEKLDEILVQDYATEEVEDGSTSILPPFFMLKAEGTETEKDETQDFVNMEEMLVDTDEKVKVCSDIDQASFTENTVAEDQEANDTAKYVEISPAREFLECNTSSKACTECIKEVNEMTIGKDNGAFVSKNSESVKNDIEDSVDLVIEEGLYDKDYQETVVEKESQDGNEKDACALTSAKDNMEETFIENEQECELHLLFGSPVVRSNPCEEKESSSDEKLAEVAISLNEENEGLKEIEQDISLHDTEKLDVVEVTTSDDNLKLTNHEGAFDSSIETSICDSTEGEHEKLQGENDDNRESTEDMATEEHAEKPHLLMEETIAETISLHDNVILEHPVSVSDEYGISSDLHSSLNAANEIDQVLTTCSAVVSEFHEGETEEMISKYENEHTTNVECEATSVENSSEGCAELKQDDKLYSNNNALQRSTDEEDNGDESNERWHEEELKILFATPVCENRTVRETGNVSFGKWDKTREKIYGEETFSPRSNDGWHGTTEAAQENRPFPMNISLHLEQEMVNQDTEDSNAVTNNDIEQQISENMETSLKIVGKVKFIEENKKDVEDSTICYKDLDDVAGEDTLIARTEADNEALLINNELDFFDPDDKKDIIIELPVEESVYDSQSNGTCIHEQHEAMVEVVEGKLNEFRELVQNGGDFNAFTGSAIRKLVEQVEVDEVDKSNARQSETENVDENQSSVVKANDTKSIADFCFEDEELNNMFATPMVNQEIESYNVVKSNNIEVRISEEIMESAFRSVERVKVIDENMKKAIVEESASEVDFLDMVIGNVSMEANTEVDISKEPKLEDSLFVDKCSDVQERVYECKTDDLSVAGHAEGEVTSDVLEDNKGIGECGDLHICENQISVITLDDTAEPAEVTTKNPETEIESVAEGAENSGYCYTRIADEQLTPVDSSFFHDQETVNRDTNEILQNCGEFDAYTDWAVTNAKEAEIDCEIEQPPSVSKVAFNSEVANVSNGFFDLAVEDEQLLPVDSSFFHDQEMVNLEIGNKMIKENSNDILQHCGGFNAFTGSASKLCAGHFHVDEFDKSNAQETEIESGHEKAPGVVKDNSSSLHDKEMVNQEIDVKMSEEFTKLAPKSGQEVQDLEENKKCIVDESIFEDGIICNQDPLEVLDEDTENLSLEANDLANLTNNELGFPEFVNIEKTKPADEIEILEKLLTDSFENQVGETISDVLEDKVCNNVEEDQQTWEEKDWSEGNSIEEDQQTWEEKDWSEANIFDDIQGDFDGIANAARGTRKSSNDASDVLTEDGEVNEFDEVNQSKETALSVANGEGEVRKDSNYESVRIQNQTAMRPNDKKCYSTTMKVKIKNTLMNGTPNKLFADMKENVQSVKKEPRTENITEAKGLTKRRALGQI